VIGRALAWASAVAAHHRGRTPRRPRWLTWLVTYRCNARCGMCDSWRLKPGTELTPSEAAHLLADLGPLDVVRLTGGEPFLREDLVDLARAVERACEPLVLHVTTNGSFPERAERLATALARPRRLRVMVSLDGLAGEHDGNRGPDAPFARALETIVRLRARGVAVSVNHTVISRRSLADAGPLRARLAALGVDVQTVVAYAGSAMYSVKLRGTRADALVPPRGYPLHPALEGADVAGFVAHELETLGRATRDPLTRLGKRYTLRGLLSRLRSDERPRPRPPCVALRSHLRLLPDGRVPVCQFNTETVGDLRVQPFDAVWRSPEAAAQRRWVDACPGCWAECEVIPSAIYSGDLLIDAARLVRPSVERRRFSARG